MLNPEFLVKTCYKLLGLEDHFGQDARDYEAFSVPTHTTTAHLKSHNRLQSDDILMHHTNSFASVVLSNVEKFLGLSKPLLLKQPDALDSEQLTLKNQIDALALDNFNVFVREGQFVSRFLTQVDEMMAQPEVLAHNIQEAQKLCEDARSHLSKATYEYTYLMSNLQKNSTMTKLLSAFSLVETCLKGGLFPQVFSILHCLHPIVLALKQVRAKRHTEDQQELVASSVITFIQEAYETALVRVGDVLSYTLKRNSLDQPLPVTMHEFRDVEHLGSDMGIVLFLNGIEAQVLAQLVSSMERQKYAFDFLNSTNLMTTLLSAIKMFQIQVPAICEKYLSFWVGTPIHRVTPRLMRWVKVQVDWFLHGLSRLMDPPSTSEQDDTIQPNSSAFQVSTAPFWSHDKGFAVTYQKVSLQETRWYMEHKKRVNGDVQNLKRLYIETKEASQRLEKFRCSFMCMAKPLFETYLLQYIRLGLDEVLHTFQSSVVSHDWNCTVKKVALDAPPEVFLYIFPFLVHYINDALHLINQLRLCALKTISNFIYAVFTSFMVETCRCLEETAHLVNMLNSHRQKSLHGPTPSHQSSSLSTQPRPVCDSQAAQTFLFMCWILDHYAIPIICSALGTIYTASHSNPMVYSRVMMVVRCVHGILHLWGQKCPGSALSIHPYLSCPMALVVLHRLTTGWNPLDPVSISSLLYHPHTVVFLLTGFVAMLHLSAQVLVVNLFYKLPSCG